MPARSRAQQRFIEANPEKFGGKKKVQKEWAVSGAAFDALPDHVIKASKKKPMPEKQLRHTTRPKQ